MNGRLKSSGTFGLVCW